MTSRIKTLVAASAMVAGAVALSSPAFAAGDAAAGEKVFKKCAVCHAIGPNAKNRVGPELNGIIGRKSGTAPGYNYSKAMKGAGITWNAAILKKYIANPKAVVPGNKMAFPGLKSAAEEDNLIAYLSSFNANGTRKK